MTFLSHESTNLLYKSLIKPISTNALHVYFGKGNINYNKLSQNYPSISILKFQLQRQEPSFL